MQGVTLLRSIAALQLLAGSLSPAVGSVLKAELSDLRAALALLPHRLLGPALAAELQERSLKQHSAQAAADFDLDLPPATDPAASGYGGGSYAAYFTNQADRKLVARIGAAPGPGAEVSAASGALAQLQQDGTGASASMPKSLAQQVLTCAVPPFDVKACWPWLTAAATAAIA